MSKSWYWTPYSVPWGTQPRSEPGWGLALETGGCTSFQSQVSVKIPVLSFVL